MQKEISINGRMIGINHPSYIIAEMSANHLQNLDRAKEIIRTAARCGADAVKLQTFRPDTITLDCHNEEFMATKGSIWEGHNLFNLYQTAFLPWEWHEELFACAKEVGITIFSSPFDFSAVDLLEKLDAPAMKIASYEIMDIPLIKKAASLMKPVIISTGIAEIEDIERALSACQAVGNDQVVLLKCVSQYPTPYEDLNLKTISDMADRFDCIAGLSDHSMGSSMDVAAVALGACMIEKHMTLSRADGGPDAQFSMEPAEFEEMVTAVRNTEKALGCVTYSLTDFQKRGKHNSRSLYVVKDIKKGEVFTPDNIRSVRPGYGIRPRYYEDILGKHASRDLSFGTSLQWEYICEDIDKDEEHYE